mgnify:CR=1 FL=1
MQADLAFWLSLSALVKTNNKGISLTGNSGSIKLLHKEIKFSKAFPFLLPKYSTETCEPDAIDLELSSSIL